MTNNNYTRNHKTSKFDNLFFKPMLYTYLYVNI